MIYNKTALVEFGRTEGRRRRKKIKIKDIVITSQREATFSGVLLNEEESMERQTNRIKKRVLMANRVLKMCNKMSRGMEVNTAMTMYKSLVRSVMDYAIFVYYPNKKIIVYKIEQAQFAGIRTAMEPS